MTRKLGIGYRFIKVPAGSSIKNNGGKKRCPLMNLAGERPVLEKEGPLKFLSGKRHITEKGFLFMVLLALFISLLFLLPVPANAYTPPGYDSNDYTKLKNFLEYGNPKNGVKIAGQNYDSDDPSTWTGVTWGSQSSKRVVEIDWFGKNLLIGDDGWDLSNFTSLRKLECSYNNLRSIDLTGCTALSDLRCINSQIRFLRVSDCTALENFICPGNNLNIITCSACTALRELDCSHNQLSSSLVVNNLANLKTLNCGSNSLTNLEAMSCNSLEYLECQNNSLETLKITNSKAFKEINCENNKIVSLNVGDCSSLKKIKCANNKIDSLRLDRCWNLEELDCRQNALLELDVSPCEHLKYLYCAYNDLKTLVAAECSCLELIEGCPCPFEEINLSGCQALVQINVGNCPLSELDLKDCESLEVLLCYNTNVSDFDLSTCPLLKTINCSGNELTDLDLSPCSLLEKLTCERNFLESLAVHCCPKLKEIKCSGNLLTSLDVNDLEGLTDLECEGNRLSDLEISDCVSLSKLSCQDNQLSELDLGGFENLMELRCQDNPLTLLNLTDCPVLKRVYCSSNNLTELALEGCRALTRLECQDNQLTSLDVSGSEDLGYLACQNNQLAALNVSGCNQLQYLYCQYNNLPQLDASDCASLKNLNCRDNELGELNLDGCLALISLDCRNNQLSELDLSDCGAIENAYCQDNELNNLNLKAYQSLKELECNNNQLVSLNLADHAAMDLLNCSHNWLSSLDLDNCSALKELNCSYNHLPALDLESCSVLKTLNCSHNHLPALDLESCVNLAKLESSYNELVDVDVSRCNIIKWLGCANNQLASIVVGSNNAITTIYCYNNQLTHFDTDDCPYLNLFYCEENLFTFATMPSLISNPYVECRYLPQKPMPLIEGEIVIAGENEIDISSQAEIDGVSTIYTWYEEGGEEIEPSLLAPGVFAFGEDFAGQRVHCSMTNDRFPEFTLKSQNILVLARPAQPNIIKQPQDITVAIAAGANFTVEAEAEGEISYQWQVSTDGGGTWTDIEGAEGESYTTVAVTLAEEGNQYRCLLIHHKDGISSFPVESEAAILYVVANPAFTLHPLDVTLAIGAKATFDVEVTADNDPLYQWQIAKAGDSDWTDIEDAVADSYSTEMLAESDNGNRYRCRAINVRNQVCSQPIYSDAATLTIVSNPVITCHPQDITVNIGMVASFSIETEIGDDLSYQWQLLAEESAEWCDIEGASESSYSTGETVFSDDGNQYRCRVINSKDDVPSHDIYSRAATLTVVGRPAITVQPQNVTAINGDTVTFTVEALADGILAYQWQYSRDGGDSWQDFTKDSQEDTYTVKEVSERQNGWQYKCLVTNTKNGVTSDSVESRVATLTVEAYKIIFIQPTYPCNQDNPLNISKGSLVICEITGDLARLGKITIRIGDGPEEDIEPAPTIYYLLPTNLPVGYHKVFVTLYSPGGNLVSGNSVRFYWETYRRGFGFGRFDFGES